MENNSNIVLVKCNESHNEFYGVFHKWFDGLDSVNGNPIQYAIIQDESNGMISQYSLINCQIKFLSVSENLKRALDKIDL